MCAALNVANAKNTCKRCLNNEQVAVIVVSSTTGSNTCSPVYMCRVGRVSHHINVQGMRICSIES
jgi:predicted DNA-binding ArsR family transcriptional regulator